MSEIKGQLLGIIIVLMVFAAVGGTMVGVFSSFTGTVQNTVNEIVSAEIEENKDGAYDISTDAEPAENSEDGRA